MKFDCGKGMVELESPFGRFGAPRGNVIPFQTMEEPRRVAEYADVVPAKPLAAKTSPSVTIALTLYDELTGGITIPVFTVAVAFNCVELSGVPYEIEVGVAQFSVVEACVTVSGTDAEAFEV